MKYPFCSVAPDKEGYRFQLDPAEYPKGSTVIALSSSMKIPRLALRTHSVDVSNGNNVGVVLSYDQLTIYAFTTPIGANHRTKTGLSWMMDDDLLFSSTKPTTTIKSVKKHDAAVVAVVDDDPEGEGKHGDDGKGDRRGIWKGTIGERMPT
ncbi:hypothetical protein ACLOJK_032780 [Asimina triloba]